MKMPQLALGLRLLCFMPVILASCAREVSLVDEGDPFGMVSVRSDARVALKLIAVDGESVVEQLGNRHEQPVSLSPGRHSLQIHFHFHGAVVEKPAARDWGIGEHRRMSVFVQEGMHHIVGTDYRSEHAQLAVLLLEPIPQKP